MSTTVSGSEQKAKAGLDQSLKLAVAISLLRSKHLHKQSVASIPESNALRWKQKAKERKQEILRLKEDLKEAEDASHCELFPQSASCKCYFFNNLGKISPKRLGDGSDSRFSDVLRRRFLRQVRFKARRRRTSTTERMCFTDLSKEDETEHLRASIDFLLDLCETNKVEANFSNWAHQAVDFIIASLKNLLMMGKNIEIVEGIINSLINRLIRRMCPPLKVDGSYHSDTDARFCVQHLIRTLGSEAYIGQRVILSVSQRVSAAAENLLFLDPFDDTFPSIHEYTFTMIQLIEFLISDYLVKWSSHESFDNILFEEWLRSVLHAKKALQLIESRNGLYALYMDRVTGKLVKQLGQIPTFQNLKLDILDDLLH